MANRVGVYPKQHQPLMDTIHLQIPAQLEAGSRGFVCLQLQGPVNN